MTTRQHLTPPSGLGTILSIWAHPDDETYLAGAIMAAARDAGQRVVCVTATSGEHGTDDPAAWPPSRLGRVRRWEASAALAVLGVQEHHVLGYADGGLTEGDPAAIARVGALIDRIRPDTILTFGRDGMTFHPDHVAVHGWVTTAWQRRGCRERLLYATTTTEFLDEHRQQFEEWNMYMTDERPTGVRADEAGVHLRLDGVELDRKLVALRAMATQTGALIDMLGLAAYAEQVAEECFVDATLPHHWNGLADLLSTASVA
jgi:LmbE family N-acetylglucosaminyl deacetylase